MKTIAITAVLASLPAMLAISGCGSTDPEPTQALGTPETVRACRATGVVEPRTCDVSCTEGRIDMRCAGECGAARIETPVEPVSCRWQSPWPSPSGETVSVKLIQLGFQTWEGQPSACFEEPDDYTATPNGQLLDFGVLCGVSYMPYRPGDVSLPNNSRGSYCVELGLHSGLGRKGGFLLGLSQQCPRNESWKGQVELAPSGDWQILPSTFRRL